MENIGFKHAFITNGTVWTEYSLGHVLLGIVQRKALPWVILYNIIAEDKAFHWAVPNKTCPQTVFCYHLVIEEYSREIKVCI